MEPPASIRRDMEPLASRCWWMAMASACRCRSSSSAGVLILRLRSCGKEVISSHISTYYSSGDDSDSNITEEEEEEEEGSEASSFGEEEKGRWRERRIGYYEGAADNGCFPWGGAVVRTWQDLPHRISGGARLLAP
ncbi:hypothetical protein OsI_29106 [Oryza sativa Indica Group]|uniref:Uncharacterized protein n=1 Tax=Oryza sativa subsp. indica TaxID=39946 RepID=B8BAK3_ORYSI|nr:hypothetical protein OsI_29106 [Oryza sativa Indica Group]